MVKKISAILLALVLCLSVMVLPTTAAAELNGTTVAFALEWDKASYKAGDTAVLSLYLALADTTEIKNGVISVGLNSEYISPDDNDLTSVATAGELVESFFKPLANYTTKSTSTYQSRIEGQNTAEENARYDWYVRIALNNNLSGSHPNAGSNKNGIAGSEVDPTVPFITYTFKVAKDVANSDDLPAAVTSGAAKCTPKQLYFKAYQTPGTSTTVADIAVAQYDVSNAVAKAPAGPAFTAPTVKFEKNQIRFADNNGAYAGKFDFRFVASVNLGSVAIDDVVLAGFAYAEGADAVINKANVEAAALAIANGQVATTNGFKITSNAYLSTSYYDGSYAMACVVRNIPDADKTAYVDSMGYIVYKDAVGELAVASYDVDPVQFKALYDANFDKNFKA